MTPIRKARKSDAKEILKLYNQSKNLWYDNSKVSKYNKKEILEYINNKKNKMLVFEKDTKIIGILLAEFHSDYVYLHTIVVDSKYRGHGIGHALMNDLVVKSKKENKVSIEAITEEHDKEMQKIFSELNYKRGKVFIAYQKKL